MTRKYPIEYAVDDKWCFVCTSHKPGKRGYPRMYKNLIYRHVYEQMKGEIPKGLVVRHTCDNTMCINPEHLILGKQSDNLKDAFERNRMPIGSKRPNAKLTEKDVTEIKELLLNTKLTQREIAEKYNVGRRLIGDIKNRKAWKHVQ